MGENLQMRVNFTSFFLSIYNANYLRDYKNPFTIVCDSFRNPRALMKLSDPFVIAISNGSDGQKF